MLAKVYPRGEAKPFFTRSIRKRLHQRRFAPLKSVYPQKVCTLRKVLPLTNGFPGYNCTITTFIPTKTITSLCHSLCADCNDNQTPFIFSSWLSFKRNNRRIICLYYLVYMNEGAMAYFVQISVGRSWIMYRHRQKADFS